MTGLSRVSLVVVGISSLALGGWITLGILNGSFLNSENWYLFYGIIGGPIAVVLGILMLVDGLLGTNLVSRK